MAPLDQPGQQETQELMELEELVAHQDPLVLLGLPVPTVTQEPQELQEKMEHLAQDKRTLLEPLEQLDQQVLQDLMDR